MSTYALGGSPCSPASGDDLKIGGGSVTKTIILPLDGSLRSERAIAYAEVLGRPLPAPVVLVHGVLTGRFSQSHPYPRCREGWFPAAT
jgi:hypothetical protein